MSRSCKLKDPVTTAAVCSTGHMAWDYAVFVGHRGSHRWLWVTYPDVCALISGVDTCLLSTLLTLAPDWLWESLYLCGCALLKATLDMRNCSKMFNVVNKIFKTWMATREHSDCHTQINVWWRLLSAVKMELRMLYVGFVTAVVSRPSQSFFH